MPHLSQRSAEKFVKKLLGENEVEEVLQKLDRLTLEEARTTVAQSLEAVYSLVQNMRAIMDGEQIPLGIFSRLNIILSRRQGTSKGCQRCSRYVWLETMTSYCD